MLWDHYVLRRGAEVHELWEQLFADREVRLLFISGRGFDMRSRFVMNQFVETLANTAKVKHAELIAIGFDGYELSDDLRAQTEDNATSLDAAFKSLGESSVVSFGVANDDEDIASSTALRAGIEKILQRIGNQTDIVLDVSSLPRVVYLSLVTSILNRLVPNKDVKDALAADGVNFQVLAAEDAKLDAEIHSEDPSSDLALIPGFSSALQAESMQHWPLVWFPILGENRTGQLQKILTAFTKLPEICPVLPHPSRDPRRAERLLMEYRKPLFEAASIPTSAILYVNEAHPFQAYRQLLLAMQRYQRSLQLLDGCRLVVTPLASKLITIGAGLACFEMRPGTMDAQYGVAISCVEPTRYVASRAALRASRPEMAALLLTGSAYDPSLPS